MVISLSIQNETYEMFSMANGYSSALVLIPFGILLYELFNVKIDSVPGNVLLFSKILCGIFGIRLIFDFLNLAFYIMGLSNSQTFQ